MGECIPKRSRRPLRQSEQEPILCSSCGVELIEGNNWYKSSCERRDYRCNSCRKSYQSKYYENNKERLREEHRKYYDTNKEEITYKQSEYKIKKAYNLSKEQYDKLLQEGCNICGSKEKLRIDHDHITGKVRGVLCHWCNVGLGHFKDSIELLDKAKGYLSWTIIKNI